MEYIEATPISHPLTVFPSSVALTVILHIVSPTYLTAMPYIYISPTTPIPTITTIILRFCRFPSLQISITPQISTATLMSSSRQFQVLVLMKLACQSQYPVLHSCVNLCFRSPQS